MEKDEFFRASHHSPLAHSGKQQSFKGLYFPPDEKFRIRIKLQRYAEPETVVMATSKETSQRFYKLGFFEFQIDGQVVKLQAYKSAEREENELFIPFRYRTSGKESYAAGRYIDLPMGRNEEENEYVIDFNYAYNPYCAYSEDYVCPLPPAENWLPVRISAGEKSYH